MIDIKLENGVPGTVIRYGNSKRKLTNKFIEIMLANGFDEISIPILQKQDIFKNKVGEENNNLMYNFSDRGERELCLAPEYTAICQILASKTFKYKRNIKLFYVQQCFRGEKPQLGRWREFTQFGVEILNPTESLSTPDGPMKNITYLQNIAEVFINHVTPNMVIKNNTKRGLDYYKEGIGFEIYCPELGTAQQVCGGGKYNDGCGFAIGLDRLILLQELNRKKEEL